MIDDMGKGLKRDRTHVRPQERDASGQGGAKGTSGGFLSKN